MSGNVTVASGKSLTLKNISASDSEVKIGNSGSSPAKATLQGATVTVESGTALNVNSHGNANVTMDAGKTLNVNGGNVKVQNTSTTVRSAAGFYVDGGDAVTVGGDEVRGKGGFKWNIAGRNDGTIVNYKSPIVFRKVQVSVNKNGSGSTVSIETLLPDMGEVTRRYVWGVVGFDAQYAVDAVQVIRGANTDRSYVTVSFADVCPQATTVDVKLIGVMQSWTDQVD